LSGKPAYPVAMARFWVRHAGNELPLPPGEHLVGRSAECLVSLDDSVASREHANLLVRDERLFIQDLKSRNGLRVNGETLVRSRELFHGDSIMIGSTELVVIDGEERDRIKTAATVRPEAPDFGSDEWQQQLRGTDAGDPMLSRRELEVLMLVGRGHTNKEVAKRIGVSVKTVETYRSRVANKLELNSRADFVRYAHQHGLLDLDDF